MNLPKIAMGSLGMGRHGRLLWKYDGWGRVSSYF